MSWATGQACDDACDDHTRKFTLVNHGETQQPLIQTQHEVPTQQPSEDVQHQLLF